jgi:uncharacterized protein YpiB (UPF0302 family)
MDSNQLAIGRTRALIDRALETGNRHRFAELCQQLQSLQRSRHPAVRNQGSKA